MGAAVSLDADATDGDNDTLTYSATGLPAGVTIASGNGRDQRHAGRRLGRHLQRDRQRDRRHRERRARRHVHLDGQRRGSAACRSGGRGRGPGERRGRAVVDGQHRARPRGLPRVPRDLDAGADHGQRDRRRERAHVPELHRHDGRQRHDVQLRRGRRGHGQPGVAGVGDRDGHAVGELGERPAAERHRRST